MKISDLLTVLLIALALAVFSVAPDHIPAWGEFAQNHAFFMSFLKFAVLCTIGELVALRITTSQYIHSGFGFIPRILMWGFIGLVIHTAFIIYATGTPAFLMGTGLSIAPDVLAHGTFGQRLGMAFSISALMNLLFAPLFMLAHSVVSMHIENTGGTLKGFFSPVKVAELLNTIDWSMLWGFVFKKTIPLFWIPAHTVTFLLPPELRVLFAALLGVVLGVILAFASLKGAKAAA